MRKIRFLVLGLLLIVIAMFAITTTVSSGSPLPTPVSPLPTPTPPGGGGGGGIDWMGWLMENWPRVVELVLLVIALVGSLLGYREARRRGVTVKGLAEMVKGWWAS